MLCEPLPWPLALHRMAQALRRLQTNAPIGIERDQDGDRMIFNFRRGRHGDDTTDQRPPTVSVDALRRRRRAEPKGAVSQRFGRRRRDHMRNDRRYGRRPEHGRGGRIELWIDREIVTPMSARLASDMFGICRSIIRIAPKAFPGQAGGIEVFRCMRSQIRFASSSTYPLSYFTRRASDAADLRVCSR